ncbi:acyltransferase family protein [Primorskyibacter sp. S187A]|uniref:acyltransferase family protein n=1 Tax=Primorskyibacter sp. S187A TaxID=3415130 RepID=UPI003C7B7B0A
MSRGLSTYLDGLRIAAAFIVLLSHFAYPRFSDGRWLWVREWNLGSDAVIVFFVLSGLVIAHVAQHKPGGIRQFTFDRATRLISVALPALLLTYALDRTGAALAPQVYEGWFYNPLPLWDMLLRGLSFSNEWQGLATRLGTNGPFWSLSYEAAYYALFAIAFYTAGLRRIALLLLGAWVFGLNILVLMPTWLMGVWLYRHLQQAHTPVPRPRAVLYAIAPVILYVLAQLAHLPAQLYALTASLDHMLDLRFSNEILWNWLLGLLVTCHLIGMAHLLRRVTDRSHLMRVSPALSWSAGGSFSLYVMHYPLLQFLAIAPLQTGNVWLDDAVLLTFVTVLCFAFAALFERPLPLFRQALSQITARRAKSARS